MEEDARTRHEGLQMLVEDCGVDPAAPVVGRVRSLARPCFIGEKPTTKTKGPAVVGKKVSAKDEANKLVDAIERHQVVDTACAAQRACSDA